MCDFSLHAVASRPAKVGDKLVTKNFGTGTSGFADQLDTDVAVCVLPGTELAFDDRISSAGLLNNVYEGWYTSAAETRVARFTQVRKNIPYAHHDALELPDGQIVMLTIMAPGQTATVLQLPAAPKTEAEAEAQRRVEVVG
jgi:hypothetical protein